MKIKFLLFATAMVASVTVNAQWKKNQTWSYSFGSSKNSLERQDNKPAISISDTKKAVLLPSPSSGQVGLFIAANSTGSFKLNGDESLTLKMGEVGITRLSAMNIASASDVVKLSLKIKFSDDATSKGIYTLGIGNNQGKLFNPKWASSIFRSNSETFTNLIWNFSPSSPQMNFVYREGSDASKTTINKTIDKTTFVKGGAYDVALYCNNSTEEQKYKVGSASYILPAGTFHIWVNNNKLGNDFPKSLEVDGDQGIAAGTSLALSAGEPLNSFLFSAVNGNPEAKLEATISDINVSYAVK